MDNQTLALLSKQQVSIIKECVTTMFDSLKADVCELGRENGDLKRSLEFTEAKLFETKALIKCQDGELKKLSEKVNKSESETLAERVRIIEDNLRKNNVIFNGIPEDVTETPEHLLENVCQILTRKLNVAITVEYCHRLGGKIDSGRPIGPY